LIDTVWGSGYILRESQATPAVPSRSEPAWAGHALAAD